MHDRFALFLRLRRWHPIALPLGRRRRRGPRPRARVVPGVAPGWRCRWWRRRWCWRGTPAARGWGWAPRAPAAHRWQGAGEAQGSDACQHGAASCSPAQRAPFRAAEAPRSRACCAVVRRTAPPAPMAAAKHNPRAACRLPMLLKTAAARGSCCSCCCIALCFMHRGCSRRDTLQRGGAAPRSACMRTWHVQHQGRNRGCWRAQGRRQHALCLPMASSSDSIALTDCKRGLAAPGHLSAGSRARTGRHIWSARELIGVGHRESPQ